MSGFPLYVFGTTGEAGADPQYKFGLRWESPKLVIAGTYGAGFDGSTGSGFEIGFSYFTDPFPAIVRIGH